MHKLVMLGTGTDVGKTYTTERLSELLATHTPDSITAVKPIETGVVSIEQTDAGRLAKASRPATPPHHAYAFETPISPHLAARRAGVEIQIDKVLSWIGRLSKPDWLLVETAGGVFSPISMSKTNFDLAKALDPSCWILVATDGLGVLHNLKSTLMAMEALGRKPDIILLNEPPVKDESTGTNREEIERLGWARVAGVVRRDGGFSGEDTPALLTLTRGVRRGP